MFEIISTGKFNSFLLQQLVISLQLLVVSALISTSYNSYKNLKLENFKKLFIAWVFNLFYLLLNASFFEPDNVFYVADITIKLNKNLSKIVEVIIIGFNLITCYFFLIASRPFLKDPLLKFVPKHKYKLIPGFIIIFFIKTYSIIYSVHILAYIYITFNILIFFFFLNYLRLLSDEYNTWLFRIGGVLYFGIQFLPIIPTVLGNIYILPKIYLLGFFISLLAKILILLGMNSIYLTYILKITNDNRFEELNENLTKFIGRVFHELNIPISSMIKTTNTLIEERESYGYTAKTFREILKSNTFAIQAEAFTIYAKELYKQKNYTFESIFDFKYSPKSEIYNINNIIETAISLVQSNSFNYLPVMIERQYSSNSYIYCSFNEILRVFVNIFQNSFDSFKDLNITQKNIILVSCRNFIENDNKKMTITISDNAAGIPTEIQDNIYLQGFSTKASDELGRGFGLTICLDLVSKYKGQISFISSIEPSNHGTTFSITLPRTTKR